MKLLHTATSTGIHKPLELMEKLRLLSAAARYDAACASSGSGRQNKGQGLGAAHQSGTCHSWSADGRRLILAQGADGGRVLDADTGEIVLERLDLGLERETAPDGEPPLLEDGGEGEGEDELG